LNVAGELLKGVEGGPKVEVDEDLETQGLAGDEAVRTDAGPGRGEKGYPEFQVQLDVRQEASVPMLGGNVLVGCSDTAHEVAGLWDQEAAVVEAVNEPLPRCSYYTLDGSSSIAWSDSDQARTLFSKSERGSWNVSTI
jgi:hypothetical protein